MIRRWCYGTIVTLFVACALISLITGEGGVHEFEFDPPEDFLDYITVGPLVMVDFVQFVFSCITWDFIPDMPTTLRIVLVALSTLPVVAVFIMDVVPQIVAFINAVVPG